MQDVERDCVQCGKRKHSFWEDPAGECYLICTNNAPGLKDCRDSSQRQSIRPSFHPEPRNTVKMGTRTDHERTENNVYEDAVPGFCR